MKLKKLILLLLVLSIISFSCGICLITYNWGYLQSAIDYGVADFSAPAFVSVISGLPAIVLATIFLITASVVFAKVKNIKKQEANNLS